MAQVSRTAHASSVSTKLADNSSGDISEQDLREVITDLEDSCTWYDECEVSNDTTPQLGGDLDVDGNSIVSTSNGNITLAPHGTGNVALGNFTFNADQSVGAGQDDYVLTYDHSAGTIGLEASAGGGGGGYTQEQIEDFAGGLFTGNTETLITATYQASDNTLDLVVDADLSNYDNSTSAFITSGGAPVQSVAGKAGAVVLVATDIASGTFEDARVASSNITQHEADLSVATSQLTGTVGSALMADEAITLAKIQHIATGSLLGRTSASSGDVEVLTTADILKTKPEAFTIAASDEGTDLTTGTEKVTFRMPYAFTVTDVRASVNVAPVGSTITVDINEGGSTILSTKLTIDAGEKTSTTAATPAVISDTSLADDAEITIDIDQIGSSTAGQGLKITLIGTQT